MPPKRTKAAKPSAAVTPKRQPVKSKSAKGKSPARARGNPTTGKSPKGKSPGRPAKGGPARSPGRKGGPAKPSKLYFEFPLCRRVYKGTYTYAEFMPNCVRWLAHHYSFLPKELLTLRARNMWEKKACEVSGCETAMQRKVRLYIEARGNVPPFAAAAAQQVNQSRVRRPSLFEDAAPNTSSSSNATSRVKRPNLFDEEDDGDDVQFDNVGQQPKVKQPETRHLVTKKVRRLEPDTSPPHPQADNESKGGWTLSKSLLASTPLPIPSPNTRARNAAVLKKKLILSEDDNSPSSLSSAHTDAHSDSPFSSPDQIREGRLAAKKPPGNSESSDYESESASGENDEQLMPPPAMIPHKSKLNVNAAKQQQAASSESDSQSSGELLTSQSSNGDSGSSQTDGDTTTSADETIDVSSTTAEPSFQEKTSRIKIMISKNPILVSSDNDSGVKAPDPVPHVESALQEFPTGKERLLTTTIERVATTTDESQSDMTDASGASNMTQVKPLPPSRVMYGKAFIPLQLRQDVNNNVDEQQQDSDDATSSDDSI